MFTNTGIFGSGIMEILANVSPMPFDRIEKPSRFRNPDAYKSKGRCRTGTDATGRGKRNRIRKRRKRKGYAT